MGEATSDLRPFFTPRRFAEPGDIVSGPHARVSLREGRYQICGTTRKGRVLSVHYGRQGQTAHVWWEDEEEPVLADLHSLTPSPMLRT